MPAGSRAAQGLTQLGQAGLDSDQGLFPSSAGDGGVCGHWEGYWVPARCLLRASNSCAFEINLSAMPLASGRFAFGDLLRNALHLGGVKAALHGT